MQICTFWCFLRRLCRLTCQDKILEERKKTLATVFYWGAIVPSRDRRHWLVALEMWHGAAERGSRLPVPSALHLAATDNQKDVWTPKFQTFPKLQLSHRNGLISRTWLRFNFPDFSGDPSYRWNLDFSVFLIWLKPPQKEEKFFPVQQDKFSWISPYAGSSEIIK